MSLSDELVIDESLYSRQQLMMGETAMKRMAVSNVFLSGLSGLGVEIAKNIALAGVKSLTLHDTVNTTWNDLSTNFYLTPADLGKNRAEVVLPKVSDLNPYTKCSHSKADFNGDLSFLDEFKCVIVTDASLEDQIRINDYCHDKSIRFISADVRGVFTWAFCDFGDNFEVFDKNGEELKEVLISSISKANPGLVTTLNDARHGLEDGDYITFKEVQGMTEVNNQQYRIKVVSPTSFSIGDTSSFSDYTREGIAVDVKVPFHVSSARLKDSMVDPSIVVTDFAKLDTVQPHIGHLALHQFKTAKGRYPGVWNKADSEEFIRLAGEVNATLKNRVEKLDESLLQKFSYTAEGSLVALTSFTGGVVAQECLKALSGKYLPLNQWVYMDAIEVLPSLDTDPSQFQPTQSRSDAQRICLGQQLCDQLAKSRLFMIGCGAIGCEMMKNYAMLGFGTDSEGGITVTDNDLIEKSNLNRQFLFKNKDLQKPKSESAANAVLAMNPNLKIKAHLDKVGPDTEKTYTNDFFKEQSVIVNALDNIEARKYVDSRCVTNRKALVESGTLGPKGHVQIIVPGMTESYGSTRDPPEKDVPFCTLKSFPNIMEHCVEWARDFSFGGNFVSKPMQFNQLMDESNLVERLKTPYGNGLDLKVVRTASKMLKNRPQRFDDCLAYARLKFESYFKKKSLQLLHSFPLDHKTDDKGTPFWTSPKRPPKPIDFDLNDATHRLFVVSLARLWAEVWDVSYQNSDLETSSIEKVLSNVVVPEFRPQDGKEIVTDESVKKPEEKKAKSMDADHDQFLSELATYFGNHSLFKLKPIDFEKDDDSNGHIDFISATSNLRARVYAIPEVDRLRIKAIAGRIMPAIATTTAAVSGCATLELIKTIIHQNKEGGLRIEDFKNLFMNLALPFWALSEPGAAAKQIITGDKYFTIWDRWDIRIGPKGTLNNLLDAISKTYGLEANGVFKGASMVYVPMFAAHQKRKTQEMKVLLKSKADTQYEDLIVTFASGVDKDVSGPPVRVHYV